MVPILSPCCCGERLEVRAARHRAVVVHDLEDHRRRLEARQPRQIAAGFGVAGARQHAAGLRHQRKDVAGLTQVSGARIGLDGRDAPCARDRAREMPVVTPSAASIETVKLVRCSRSVSLTIERQPQLLAALARQREADQAAAVARHEIDVLGAHVVRGHDQVAFVLAILVVHDHDHAAGAMSARISSMLLSFHAGMDDRRSR